MATCKLILEVKTKWWLMLYINTLVFLESTFNIAFDVDKVMKIVERGITFTQQSRK